MKGAEGAEASNVSKVLGIHHSEAKPFDKNRNHKVGKALGLATDLTCTQLRAVARVLPSARLPLSPNMTVTEKTKSQDTSYPAGNGLCPLANEILEYAQKKKI